MYATQNGIAIPKKSDDLFPMLAIHHFPQIIGIIFIIGLTAASFASADSALTSLTTSFCLDILHLKPENNSKQSKQKRHYSHIAFGILIILCIYLFNYFREGSIISIIFKVAGYTYGPLLGLFAFGLITKKKVKEQFVPYLCIICPLITFGIEYYINNHPSIGYKIGFETLIINAGLLFVSLFFIHDKGTQSIDR
jgi:Na+/proline symporter